MERLREYIRNIDFECVDDADVLSNVYDEIDGHEKELILSTETTYQIETLVKRSNAAQIQMLLEKLDIGHLISKSLGSRVLEAVYDVVFDMAHVLKLDINPGTLIEATEKHLRHRILDANATHVIRKLFQLVSGRRIAKDRVERFTPIGDIEKYKPVILCTVPEIVGEDSLVTLLCYLRCHRSQTIIYETAKRHFSSAAVCEPAMSYFFENLAKIAGKKTLKLMFEETKDRVMDLCRDKYANYFVGELILQHHEESEFFFNAIDQSCFESGSNVIMKLVQALQKAGLYAQIDSLVQTFYQGEDILAATFGGEEGNFKQKYAPMLAGFMRLPEKHSYSINQVFRTRFCSSWLRSRGGVELLTGYYEGLDSNSSKREFTRGIEKHVPMLLKRRECVSLLALMAKYTGIQNTRLIKQQCQRTRNIPANK